MADTSQATVGEPEPFPPIGSYGFLSDCETGALLSADGAIEWLCLPRFDSPSIFGARPRPRRRHASASGPTSGSRSPAATCRART